MKEIKYFNNEYIFIANILLLLTYLQSNMLMFRLFLMSSCLFFFMFSFTFPKVSIDTVLFNLSFYIINILLSIPLIKKIVPPNFSKEQKEIFKNHFRNYLTPIELDVLLANHRRKIFKVPSGVVKLGNEFSSLFFIAKIGKHCTCELKTKKRNFDLEQYSWVGIPEYLNLISRKESLAKALKEFDTGEWGVTLNVQIEEPSEDENLFEDDQVNYENNPDGTLNIEEKIKIITNPHPINEEDNTVIIYEFELRHLDKVFTNPSYGTSIMRGLHSIWLKYCSEVVRKVDQSNAINSSTILNPSGTKVKERVRNISFHATSSSRIDSPGRKKYGSSKNITELVEKNE